MKLKSVLHSFFLTGLAVVMACSSQKENDTRAWLVPFVKVDSVNPVLLPGNNSFTCPVWQREIQWENKDVFNPAAVVRNNQVYLIFRAEDTMGRFNGTSRL